MAPSRVPVGPPASRTLLRSGAGSPPTGLLPGGRVDPRIQSEINAARSSGRPLAGPVRQRLESGLGEPLDDVRVHADARSAALARAVAARAFTVGSDLFFGAGEYRPGSRDGDALIAHEATHVVQQRGGPSDGPLTVSSPGDRHEVEADTVSAAIQSPTWGRPPAVTAPTAPGPVTGAATTGATRAATSGPAPSMHRSCCSGCATGSGCEQTGATTDVDDAALASGPTSVATGPTLPAEPSGPTVAERTVTPGISRRTLARYAHQDCTQDDLEQHIWPADSMARAMVRRAISALEANPIDPVAQALLPKYFMEASPHIPAILRILDQVEIEFRANDYTYECEDDCKSTDNGYTWSGAIGALTSSHIHLCMNNFRSRGNPCLARTIVHEFTHRYAGTDDHGYCKTGCGFSPCPASLTPPDALDNADSYACFAYELWQTSP